MSSLNASGNIRVKCKRCGRLSPANEFVIDHINKVMVCAACAKGAKPATPTTLSELAVRNKPTVLKARIPAPSAPIAPAKKVVVDDPEEEKMAAAYNEKKAKLGAYPRIDDEKVRYRCGKCGYQFPYNKVKQTPAKCPYCAYQINWP